MALPMWQMPLQALSKCLVRNPLTPHETPHPRNCSLPTKLPRDSARRPAQHRWRLT